MAYRPNGQPNNGQRVVGNLAYDFDYEESAHEAPRPRREETPAREYRPAPRRVPKTRPQMRPRQKVSPVVLVSFAALALMLVALLVNYAQLTVISNGVVELKRQQAALQEENVRLLTRYEQTYDLATVQAAAAAAGMTKPSSSQIFYVDLSAPDSVTIYQQENTNVFTRIFTSLGQGVCAVVEYFR